VLIPILQLRRRATGTDSLPHALEIERASQRPGRVARPFSAAPSHGLRRL
jgi:hypothetical protein